MGKDLTFPIEASNSDLRHWLARMTRKTKASSRSLEMVGLSLALAHHMRDPQVMRSYTDPLLSLFG